MGAILILVDALVLVLHNSMHNVISRGYYVEARETFAHCFFIFAVAAIYMFATQSGNAFSRIILFLTFLLHIAFGYGSRILWKLIIKKRRLGKESGKRMLVVSAPESAEGILRRLDNDDLAGYQISGVILTEHSDQASVAGFPVVSDIDGAADYIVKEWIDSVYIDAPLSDEKVVRLMDACAQMAVPTHYHVPNIGRNGGKRFSEKIGGTIAPKRNIHGRQNLAVQ